MVRNKRIWPISSYVHPADGSGPLCHRSSSARKGSLELSRRAGPPLDLSLSPKLRLPHPSRFSKGGILGRPFRSDLRSSTPGRSLRRHNGDNCATPSARVPAPSAASPDSDEYSLVFPPASARCNERTFPPFENREGWGSLLYTWKRRRCASPPISGQSGVAGAHVTVGTDGDLMAGAKMAPGKISSDLTTGHELEHANDGITAGQSSLAAGRSAMSAGDVPFFSRSKGHNWWDRVSASGEHHGRENRPEQERRECCCSRHVEVRSTTMAKQCE